MDGARGVFRRGYDHLRQQGLKEERVKLLEAWRAAEKAEGTGKTAGLKASNTVYGILFSAVHVHGFDVLWRFQFVQHLYNINSICFGVGVIAKSVNGFHVVLWRFEVVQYWCSVLFSELV